MVNKFETTNRSIKVNAKMETIKKLKFVIDNRGVYSPSVNRVNIMTKSVRTNRRIKNSYINTKIKTKIEKKTKTNTEIYLQSQTI